MKVPSKLLKLLQPYAEKPLAENGEMASYSRGLQDGATILAQELLKRLEPDDVIPEEIKGLE